MVGQALVLASPRVVHGLRRPRRRHVRWTCIGAHIKAIDEHILVVDGQSGVRLRFRCSSSRARPQLRAGHAEIQTGRQPAIHRSKRDERLAAAGQREKTARDQRFFISDSRVFVLYRFM